MEEHVFLEENGVKVTNARFVTFGRTQALAGITSVSCLVRKPSKTFPIILIIVGCLTVAGIPLLGIALIVIGVLLLVLRKNTYIVQLESAAGTADALESKDAGFIDRVVEALNNAIISRG